MDDGPACGKTPQVQVLDASTIFATSMPKKALELPADWRDYLAAKVHEALFLLEQLDRLRRAHEIKTGTTHVRRTGLEVDPSLVAACDEARALLEEPEVLAARLTAPTIMRALAVYEQRIEELAQIFWSKDAEAFTTRMRQLEASRRMRHHVIEEGLSETAALTAVAREMNFHDAKSVRRLLRRSKRTGMFPTKKQMFEAVVERLKSGRGRAHAARPEGHK